MADLNLTAVLEGRNESAEAFDAFERDIARLEAMLDRVDGRDIEVGAGVGLTDFEAEIKEIERAIERVDGRQVGIGVQADTAGASASLNAITAQAVGVGALDPTIRVDVDTAGAATQLTAFQGQAAATTAATQGLTGALTGGGVLGAGSSSPAVLIGALALIIPIAAGVLAALGPLAAGLTVLVGVAGTAAAGFGLLAGAVAPLVVSYGKLKEQGEAVQKATQAQRDAQDRLNRALSSGSESEVVAAREELAQATRDLTRAQNVLNRESDKYGGVLKDLKREAGELKRAYFEGFSGSATEAGKFGVELLKLAQRTMPALGREAKETVGAIRSGFRQAGRELGRGERNSLLSILDSVSGIMGSLTRSGARFGGALANIFAIAVPHAEKLTGWIEDMSKRLLDFTRSAGGRRSIKDFFDSAVPVARSLARITGNVISDIVAFGKTHGPALAKAIDLISDSLDALGGNQKDAREDGRKMAKNFAGGANAGIREELVKEGPSVGERWGQGIGKGLGNFIRGMFENKSGPGSKAANDAAGDFGGAFIRGFRDAFKGFDWMEVIFGDPKRTTPFKDTPIGKMLEDIKKYPSNLIRALKGDRQAIIDVAVFPFRQIYKIVVGNSIIPDLVRDVLKELGKLVAPGGIRRTLRGLVGIFEDIFGAAAKVVANFFRNLLKRDGLNFEDLYDDGKKYLGMLRDEVDTTTKDIEEFIRTRLNAGARDGISHMERLKTASTEHLRTFQRDGTSAVDTLVVNVTGELDRMRSEGIDDAVALKDRSVGAMREFEAEAPPPVSRSVSAILGYFDDLLSGMQKVIDEAGLDVSMGGSSGGSSGTRTPSSGSPAASDLIGTRKRGAGSRRARAFAAGGVLAASSLHAFADGGMFAGEHIPGYVDRPTVLAGEALTKTNREYVFITEEEKYEGRNRELWRELGQRKKWLDIGDSDDYHYHPPIKHRGYQSDPMWRVPDVRMAEGGTLDVRSMPTSHPNYPGWASHVAQAAHAFQKVGANDVTSYATHEGGGNGAFSIDTWVGGSSYGNRPSDPDKFWGFANWVVGNAGGLGAQGVIADNKAQYPPGSGWSTYRASPTTITDMHLDHVHVYMPSPGSGAVGANLGAFFSPGGQGGGGGIDIMPFIEKHIKEVPDLSGHPGPDKIMTAAAEKVREGVVQKLMAMAPSSSSAGIGAATEYKGDWASAVGGSPTDNKGIVLAAAKELGWSDQLGAWDSIIMRESGYDRFAKNPSSGAYGIPQSLPESKLPPAGQSSGGSHAGPQVAWMADYIKERYGDVNGAEAFWNANGYYTNGGFALKPQVAAVAENGPEFFMPLHDPKSAREFVGFLERIHPRGFDDEETMRHHVRESVRRENYASEMPERRRGESGSGMQTEAVAGRFEGAVERMTTRIESKLSERMNVRLDEVDDLVADLLAVVALNAQASPGGQEIQAKNRTRKNRKSLERMGG